MARLHLVLIGLSALSSTALLSSGAPSHDGAQLLAGGGSDRLIGQSTNGRGGDSVGGGADSGLGGYDAAGLPVSETEALSIPVPVQVAGVLNRSAQVCGKLPDEYAIDCLIVHLRQAISVTPQGGKYSDVHKVLSDTVRKLDKIVAANLDDSKDRIRLKAGGATTERMRAIRPETVRRANAEAAKIVAEAETILLRSASQHAGARLDYVRIAEAVGSNKLLLRS